MKLSLLFASSVLLGVCSALPGCRSEGGSKPVIVPRLVMEGAGTRLTVVYRKDPSAPKDLLLCPLKFDSQMGEPGADPYADPEDPTEGLLIYRYRATDGALVPEKLEVWRSAGTLVGSLHLSASTPHGVQLDHATKSLIGQKHTSPLAGAYSGYLIGSPSDPTADEIDYDSFGGEGSTHAAVLTAAHQDRPGLVPTTGGALRAPYFVQIFSAPDGAQVGPTRKLESDTDLQFPPVGGWTPDGQYIIYFYPFSSQVWIIPTPEVLDAHDKGQQR